MPRLLWKEGSPVVMEPDSTGCTLPRGWSLQGPSTEGWKVNYV